MTAESSATIFHVSDLESAIAYYVDVLGFTVEFRYEQIAGVKYGNVKIHLSGPNPYVSKKTEGEGHMYIFCDEVDDYYRGISAKGALIVTEPGDRGYLMRDFTIKDADGNILALGMEIDEPTKSPA